MRPTFNTKAEAEEWLNVTLQSSQVVGTDIALLNSITRDAVAVLKAAQLEGAVSRARDTAQRVRAAGQRSGCKTVMVELGDGLRYIC
jgi:hypothetical protein